MSKIYNYCKHILYYTFLIVYIVLLAKSLLFKEVSLFELFRTDRTVVRNINLIPFQSIFEYMTNKHFNIWIAFMNVVGNIVIFIPLGLYLQIYKKNKKILNSVAIAGMTSLCVEIIQYIAGIGYTDIDDIILNTFGALLGILIYKMMFLLLKSENKIKTAVTFLYCLTALIVSACYMILVHVFGYMIKIF